MNIKFKNFISLPLISSLIFMILMNSGNLISWIFQILITRHLSKEEISIFFSLVAFVGVIIAPFSTFNLYLQKRFISLIKNENSLIPSLKDILKFKIFYICIITIILFTFKDNIFEKFQHYNTFTYLNFLCVFIFSILTITPISIINSYQKYLIPGLIYIVADFSKLILAFIFLNYFFGNKFDVVLMINLYFVSFIIIGNLIYVLKSIPILNNNKYYSNNFYSRKNLKEVFLFMSYSLCTPILINTDIIVVKWFYNSEISANYILASTLSKISYFFSSVLFSIIYNETIIKNLKIKADYSFILTIVAILMSFLITLLVILFADKIIIILYGMKFIDSLEILYILCPTLFFISIINLITNNLISKNRFNFIFYFLFYLLTLVLILNYFNFEIIIFAKIQLLLVLTILIALIITFFLKKKDV